MAQPLMHVRSIAPAVFILAVAVLAIIHVVVADILKCKAGVKHKNCIYDDRFATSVQYYGGTFLFEVHFPFEVGKRDGLVEIVWTSDPGCIMPDGTSFTLQAVKSGEDDDDCPIATFYSGKNLPLFNYSCSQAIKLLPPTSDIGYMRLVLDSSRVYECVHFLIFSRDRNYTFPDDQPAQPKFTTLPPKIRSTQPPIVFAEDALEKTVFDQVDALNAEMKRRKVQDKMKEAADKKKRDGL